MKTYFISISLCLFLFSCGNNDNNSQPFVETVNGPIPAGSMGMTLEHEHLAVDFIGAEKVVQPRYTVEFAVDTLLPYYVQLRKMGVNTVIECTPNYIGRDVRLLKQISDLTKLNILTNTGYYAAANKNFLPAHAYTETADQLANRWIEEWKNGIDGTGIRPGFVKLGVLKESLDSVEQKIVRAGAKTHLATGLKVAIHTGGAAAAFDEIKLFKDEGASPAALIVVHSQNMSSADQLEVLRQGAWVSLDGVREADENIEKYAQFLLAIKENGFLDQTLISQDNYWSVEENEGEIYFEFHGSTYTAILDKLRIRLSEEGFSETEFKRLLEQNPAKAFAIEKLSL